MKRASLVIAAAFGTAGFGLLPLRKCGRPRKHRLVRRPRKLPPRRRLRRIGPTTRRRSRPFSMLSPRPSTPAMPRAAAATYTETAIVVDEEGERIEGAPPSATSTPLVRRRSREHDRDPGRRIPFSRPESALEEGRTTITPAAGAGAPGSPVHGCVRQARRPVAPVRGPRRAAAGPPARDHLKELEWLVGDWVNESQDAVVSTTCKWAMGGNFLDREFTMKTKGQPVLSGTQRIGWDPLKRQFKTWIFDSEGRPRRRILDPHRQRVGDQGRRRQPGRPTARPRTSSRDWARTA